MLKKKSLKTILILACLLTLIMPYTSTVFAAISHKDTEANLQIVDMFPGGEASGNLTDEQKAVYDKTPYSYTVGTTHVFKIIEAGDLQYQNAFYCLDALKAFPGVNSDESQLLYQNVGDFNDSTDPEVTSLYLSTLSKNDSEKWNANYKSLLWLFENVYLAKQDSARKDAFLEKAFADYTEYGMDVIKAYLTDDDIDVVQQFVIWYFTNGDNELYANEGTLPAINRTNPLVEDLDQQTKLIRKKLADHLYEYLRTEAVKAATATDTAKTVTNPTFEDIEAKASITDEYYVAGPFKINPGTFTSSEYTASVLDENGNPVTDYKVLISGETEFTSKKINEIANKEFSIYLPKSTTVSEVTVELKYETFETKSSLWQNNKEVDGVKIYQPVVLITRENTPHNPKIKVVLDKSEPDLALRKYIVKINGENQDRQPTVDISKLKDGSSTTAEYKHSKEPLKVVPGDKVVYEIRVYNEGNTAAENTVIADALPKGLIYVEDSTINATYGWTKTTDGENRDVYTTDYLKDKIDAFDKKNDTELPSAYVQIECQVTEELTSSSVLTNIAEILTDAVDDTDSVPGNNDYIKEDNNSSDYTGDKDNPEDLSKDDYYYKGREDDDDFEKVKVEVPEEKTFDLSLQKFITKINGKDVNPDRTPVVDVTPLKEGKTDAKYTTVKTPLSVKVGDIVTYTIRVYNEGELSGYAEEVADYLPEGLGFLDGYTANVDNYWKISEECVSVKLNTIENGKSNLKLSDFTGVTTLDEVNVIKGKVKLTSTKLKSSDVDSKNLISGFNPENGTVLNYKDIEVTCIVLSNDSSNNKLRNIGEITKDSNENREEVIDRDSTPDTANPDTYPGDESKQDDNDYENLTPEPEVKKNFDLSLKKFITALNGNEVTGREPKVTKGSDGKPQITNNNTAALPVANNDLVTYTIRVYNEGDTAGYAEEISDNLPAGLEFVADNETNKKYGWKLYDKSGNETTDLNQALIVKTDYLSKEKSEARNENTLLKAYDAEKSTISYLDIDIVFKVVESKIDSSRKIINVAEITDDADENGDPIVDVDSTPGNGTANEDDIDQEQVYVKYFDLSLQKDLSKIIVTENDTTREIAISPTDGLQKVAIHRKRIESTIVKFVYTITVKNEGEIAGYATEITDYIPEGLEFIAEDNPQWTKLSDKAATTNALSKTLLEPGKTASVQITLKWINGDSNFGMKVNQAEISEHKNDSNSPDIDSTPGNYKTGEDDIDDAPVMLEITTGTAPTYIALTTTVIAILATGILLIKKYVL